MSCSPCLEDLKQSDERDGPDTSHYKTYHVTDLGVTDYSGEKGVYTGSVILSTFIPHGYGRLKYDIDGRGYEGDWKHGRWHGKGRLSNGHGDVYEGALKNDLKHGNGVMHFADGRTYEGEYINGNMVYGKMTYVDGSTYEGSWSDGMRHGLGRCVFPEGSSYEGTFKEGEFHGFGKVVWSDDGFYEGDWEHGEMHGKGREIRPNGSLRHNGEFHKGIPVRHQQKNQDPTTCTSHKPEGRSSSCDDKEDNQKKQNETNLDLQKKEDMFLNDKFANAKKSKRPFIQVQVVIALMVVIWTIIVMGHIQQKKELRYLRFGEYKHS